MQMRWEGNSVHVDVGRNLWICAIHGLRRSTDCAQHKHGRHIIGLIKSLIDQDDEHINVVADDTGRANIRISLVVMQSAVRQRENMCQQ